MLQFVKFKFMLDIYWFQSNWFIVHLFQKILYLRIRSFCSNKLKISDPGADINCGFRDLEKISLLCLKMISFVVSVHPGNIVIIEG